MLLDSFPSDVREAIMGLVMSRLDYRRVLEEWNKKPAGGVKAVVSGRRRRDVAFLHDVAGVAIAKDDELVIGMLLPLVRELNPRFWQRRDSLLHLVLNRKKFDLAEQLVEAGASLTARNADGKTVLFCAATVSAEAIKRFVSLGCPVDSRDKNGWTPLFQAVVYAPGECVQALIEAGANINARSKRESFRRIRRIVGQFRGGLNIDMNNGHGETPLTRAIGAREPDAAKLLLEAGADPNLRGDNGEVPLYWAILFGNVDIARLLLEKGADPNARDRDGDTCLYDVASMFTGTGVMDVPEEAQQAILELLLEYGATVNTRNKKGQSPLHYASWRSALVVKRLLQAGAELNTVSKDGRSPLHEAMVSGNEETVRLYLDSGAKADVVCKLGTTTLHLACWNGKEEFVPELIERGASLTQRDWEGGTALHAAASGRALSAIECLVRAGADLNAINKERKTPLDLALTDRRRDADQEMCAEYDAVAEALIALGAKRAEELTK